MCEPLRHSADDSQPCAQYLKQATEIFIKWKLSRTAGLTSETFTACIQTMGAIPELATYLQERHGFSYVLTGKFMSDPIEGRFGWYHQVNGGNFFMSVKQVLEAEKKIRSLSLLQQQALVSAVGMTDLDGVPLTESDIAATEDVSWLIDFLSTISLDDLSEVDANIAFFVTGYIARSAVRRRRCSGCKELLVKHDDAPQIQNCVPEEHAQLFSMADRGGLSAPTELCFTLTALAVQYFMAISLAEHIKFKLFHLSNQRSAFVKAVLHTKPPAACVHILEKRCSSGHLNAELILKSAFNCFAKNEVKRLNFRREAPSPMVANRKIRKLTGKTMKN